MKSNIILYFLFLCISIVTINSFKLFSLNKKLYKNNINKLFKLRNLKCQESIICKNTADIISNKEELTKLLKNIVKYLHNSQLKSSSNVIIRVFKSLKNKISFNYDQYRDPVNLNYLLELSDIEHIFAVYSKYLLKIINMNFSFKDFNDYAKSLFIAKNAISNSEAGIKLNNSYALLNTIINYIKKILNNYKYKINYFNDNTFNNIYEVGSLSLFNNLLDEELNIYNKIMLSSQPLIFHKNSKILNNINLNNNIHYKDSKLKYNIKMNYSCCLVSLTIQHSNINSCLSSSFHNNKSLIIKPYTAFKIMDYDYIHNYKYNNKKVSIINLYLFCIKEEVDIDTNKFKLIYSIYDQNLNYDKNEKALTRNDKNTYLKHLIKKIINLDIIVELYDNSNDKSNEDKLSLFKSLIAKELKASILNDLLRVIEEHNSLNEFSRKHIIAITNIIKDEIKESKERENDKLINLEKLKLIINTFKYLKETLIDLNNKFVVYGYYTVKYLFNEVLNKMD